MIPNIAMNTPMKIKDSIKANHMMVAENKLSFSSGFLDKAIL